ncbi:MAG: Asp-tRNA(Asn)/Glu-tRNA(Gln) amidotransferase subunit GatC [Parachlamydiaceae bacterium]|nr:Asp-tRNA(Asn)/Glu-tRNA(Gln) amidotransferase subunit GatC [Parachlamydiaceae bacterium]
MAKLDKQTIAKLTKLCRIDCNEAEQEALLGDLKKILDYIELLQEIDTEGVPPCNHVLADMVNVTREDTVGATMPRETFLSNAPSHVGGMVRVPPIIKNHS